MNTTFRRWALLTLLLFSSHLGSAAAVAAADDAAGSTGASPWDLLTELRRGLTDDGPLTARFSQTFIPAGFSDGDQESGHLSIWLPSCLRWNYSDGKSVLICDGEVHQWNEDEPGGRIFAIDPAAEPGLDLLLVDVATLQERYNAERLDLDGGTVLELSVSSPAEGNFSARIYLDAAGTRVTRMEYSDSAGDLTRFDITEYQHLSHLALFKPPSGLEWTAE